MGATAGLAVAAVPPLFETLRWTAPGAELEALASYPDACMMPADTGVSMADATMIGAGEALFNAPSVLGGQAAKAGLNCASCHVNGRDNPHFQMAGVSDRPGTADVTNSFFSAARSNGRFDPVPIPDLAAAGKISRTADGAELEPFIRNLIVEEFSGREPSPNILLALASYVRKVGRCKNDDKAPVPRALSDQLQLVQHALSGAVVMVQRKDQQGAQAMLAAARHQLGLISERYAGIELKRERTLLLRASRELQSMGNSPSSSTQFAKVVDDWKGRFETRVVKPLKTKEGQSLYAADRLAAAMEGISPSR